MYYWSPKTHSLQTRMYTCVYIHIYYIHIPQLVKSYRCSMCSKKYVYFFFVSRLSLLLKPSELPLAHHTIAIALGTYCFCYFKLNVRVVFILLLGVLLLLMLLLLLLFLATSLYLFPYLVVFCIFIHALYCCLCYCAYCRCRCVY